MIKELCEKMKATKNYYSLERPEIAAVVPKNIRTILDIGCGEGAFLQFVKEQTGAETWGIEVVKEVAEKANARADNILIGKIEDVLSLIPDHYFDCITFNDVLEHLIEPLEVLKMIKTKLTPKGIIIASVPNVRYFFNLYGLVIKKDWKYEDTGILDSTHLRFFTKKSMKRMFEEADYTLINHVGINKVISWKFQLFHFFTMGVFGDTKYERFVCIAKTN